ncbi:hypothetical protein JOS77_28915 [Chromobacterium haemolyticum]|nr:hypothetical protein JOS77_28915 [Chromobacterium haemolyticum]
MAQLDDGYAPYNNEMACQQMRNENATGHCNVVAIAMYKVYDDGQISYVQWGDKAALANALTLT